MELVKTTCSMCATKCGIDVWVENGKISKIDNMQEHMLNRRCAKGYAIAELLASKDRLTDPLKKVGNGWQKISWDEALGIIAEKLTTAKQKYGAESFLFHAGFPWNSSHTQLVMRRFTDLYGTPNFTNLGALCYVARPIAHQLTLGSLLSTTPYGDSRSMILWGVNPEETWPPHARGAHITREKGGQLIVIDPRDIPSTKKAQIHARIRPGTDCALALGLLHVIINENLYDKAFVERWTVGFDQLVEHIKPYTPEKVEKITEVPANTVKAIARIYAENKPGAIIGGAGLEQCSHGVQTLRAIAILIAITGNIDVPGGNNITQSQKLGDLRFPDKIEEKITGGDGYPIFSKGHQMPSITPIIDQLVTEKPYPIKTMLLAGSNALLSWPNTNKVIRGFNKLDFIAAIDIFMTETTKMADIVLPGSTFLERADFRTYNKHYGEDLIVLTNKVVEPLGNSMEDWRIFAELGKRMGYAEYFPWENNDELVAELIKPTNITLEQLKQNPGGVLYTEKGTRRYLKHGFNTPSGKVEIFSETLNQAGYDPLPTFHEPLESPISCPDLAEKYPLVLMTGSRINAFTHSQYHNLPRQRKQAPEPYVQIHPQTASKYDITDGAMVKVESIRGAIELKAQLSEGIGPNLLSIQMGWNEANVNCLTNDMNRDPISSFTELRSVLCRVTKL